VGFAENIPDRDLDAAEHAHHADIGPLRETGRVNPAKQGFDMMRILAGDKTFEGILDHGAGDIPRYRDTVTLADTLDTVIGGDLDDYPERAADTAGRHRDPGFDVLQYHLYFPRPDTRPKLL
jgi:hypothetical protein